MCEFLQHTDSHRTTLHIHCRIPATHAHVRHQVLYFYSYFLVVLTSTSMVDPCFLLHHSLIFAMFSSRVCTAGFKPSALVSHEAFLWLIHVRCWHYSSLCLQQRQFCYLSEQLQLSSTWREARGRLFESRGGSRHFINGCFEFEQRSLTRCHRWVW